MVGQPEMHFSMPLSITKMPRNPRVNVVLERTQSEYGPGDVVQGRVVLSLAKAVDGAVLTAALQCRVVVEYRDIDALLNRYDHILHSEEIVLSRVNTRFPCGDHAFEVKWTLPANLPVHGTTVSTIAKESIETGVRKTRPDVDVLIGVPVRVPASKRIVETSEALSSPMHGSTTLALKSWWLFSAGSCTLEATGDTNFLDRKRPLVVQTTIRNHHSNHSIHRLSRLHAELVRDERLQTPKHHMSNTSTVLHCDCTASLPAACQAPPNERSLSLSLDTTTLDAKIGDHHSQFMEIAFAVKLTCQLSNGSKVSVVLPVHIVAAQ